jgi:hypothetical protein
LDVDNIVVCQRPIDDDAPYHYAFGNRQGAGNHGGRVPLRTINQQNHNQFGVSGYGAPPLTVPLLHRHRRPTPATGRGSSSATGTRLISVVVVTVHCPLGVIVTPAMVIPGIDGRDFD